MRPPGLVARRALPSIAALLAAVILLAVTGGAPALAHTDLEFTLPTDGAAVGEPVAEITVGFTDPVTLVGPGFEVLTPTGAVLAPFVATDDDRVFLLQLDPPLAGGDVAVRYEVRAEDGHTITGSFVFTVSAEAPTTTVAPTTITTTTPSPAATTTTSNARPDATSATTVPSTPAATAPATPPASPPSTDPSLPSDDSGPASGWYVGIAAAVVIGAGAFLLARSRSSTPG